MPVLYSNKQQFAKFIKNYFKCRNYCIITIIIYLITGIALILLLQLNYYDFFIKYFKINNIIGDIKI